MKRGLTLELNWVYTIIVGTNPEQKGGEIVKIDAAKFDIVLARKCKTVTDLRPGISPQTIAKLRRGEEVKPIVVGRIAQLLKCDVSELIKEGEQK